MEANWKLFGRTHATEYQLARRRTFLKIDLDQLTKNVNILRKLCSDQTDIIGVVKGNAYGHGSVEICRHLARHGVSHFAVASPWEGIELRKAGICSFIQIFGNACEEEIPDLLEYDLTPTAGSTEFLTAWIAQIRQNREHCPGNILSPFEEEDYGSVVIKVDTGMSRNGCQPEELDSIMNFCDEHNIHVHSIMTHFAQAWDDPEFTNEQLESFMTYAKKYRERGIKLHAANSAGTLLGFGTDLDFVRPGIAMYGLPPGVYYIFPVLIVVAY